MERSLYIEAIDVVALWLSSTPLFFELSAAFLAYIVLLFAANALERTTPRGGFRVMLALLPMVGMVAALWTIIRSVKTNG